MAKSKEKLQARKLRKNGESIKSIARKLSISPSTVSIWCRDIELTPEQINLLERNARDPLYGRRLLYAQKQRKAKIEKIARLYNEGKQEIGKLTKRELFLFGIALYWAEGFKKDSQVGFANSNPFMIQVFIEWLVKCCGCTKQDLSFRLTINHSHAHRAQEIQNYWSEVCCADLSQFQKTFYQKVTWKKQYENPNEYFGVLRVRVRKSTDFLRKISGWIDGCKLVVNQDQLQ